MKENRDALNPNFKLFSLKNMMYLSRWYCIYRPSTSWNCLQIYANIDKFVNIRYIFLLARRAYSWLFQLAQMWKLLAPGVGLGDASTNDGLPEISKMKYRNRIPEPGTTISDFADNKKVHARRVLSIIRAWFLFYVKHALQYVNGHAVHIGIVIGPRTVVLASAAPRTYY
jgi:hypothetical protein